MRTFLRMKNERPRRLPPEFRDDEVRYADELVATFLRRYTRPGDLVFDPFAGFGTTLIVAEALGRIPLGIEIEAARVAYIRGQLTRPDAVIHGDSRRLGDYPIPPVDFIMTSPPFMAHGDAEDPLTNYHDAVASYETYLQTLASIFAQARRLLKPTARVAIEVANLKGPAGVTPLAWDVARAIMPELRFEGEVVVGWDSYGYGYDHSYCLVFSAR